MAMQYSKIKSNLVWKELMLFVHWMLSMQMSIYYGSFVMILKAWLRLIKAKYFPRPLENQFIVSLLYSILQLISLSIIGMIYYLIIFQFPNRIEYYYLWCLLEWLCSIQMTSWQINFFDLLRSMIETIEYMLQYYICISRHFLYKKSFLFGRLFYVLLNLNDSSDEWTFKNVK